MSMQIKTGGLRGLGLEVFTHLLANAGRVLCIHAWRQPWIPVKVLVLNQ